jgi:hypothetical protein
VGSAGPGAAGEAPHSWADSLYATRLLHLGALGLLLFIVGGTWDVSWHIVIGRDTFWSPPHLMLYAGINLVPAVLIGAAIRARRLKANGRRTPGPGFTIARLHISAGVVVAAIGGVMALASAPVDEYWHSVFGIDIVIWSPPHIQLVLGVAFAGLGLMAAAAGELAALERAGVTAPPIVGRLGPESLIIALGALLFTVLMALYGEFAFDIPPYPIWQGAVVASAVAIGCFSLVRSTTRRNWAATQAALTALAILFVTELVLWVTPLIAAVADGWLPAGYWPTDGLAHLVPALSLPAAIAIDIGRLRAVGQARTAAAAATVFVVSNLVWYEVLRAVPAPWRPTTLSWFLEIAPPHWLLAIVAGSAAGWAGAMLGRTMRPTSTSGSPITPGRVASRAAVVAVCALGFQSTAHASTPTQALPEVTFTWGADRAVAGEKLDFAVTVDPPSAVPAQFDEVWLSADRGAVELRERLTAGAAPGTFTGSVVLPTPHRWGIALVFTGGHELVFDWWTVDVGTPPEGEPLTQVRELEVRSQDLRAAEDTWSGAFLIGKLSVSLFTAVLGGIALVALRRAQ